MLKHATTARPTISSLYTPQQNKKLLKLYLQHGQTITILSKLMTAQFPQHKQLFLPRRIYQKLQWFIQQSLLIVLKEATKVPQLRYYINKFRVNRLKSEIMRMKKYQQCKYTLMGLCLKKTISQRNREMVFKLLFDICKVPKHKRKYPTAANNPSFMEWLESKRYQQEEQTINRKIKLLTNQAI